MIAAQDPNAQSSNHTNQTIRNSGNSGTMEQQVRNCQQSPVMETITPEEGIPIQSKQPPASPSELSRVRQMRQTKRLSLNFPVLIPSTTTRTESQSASPSNMSPHFVHHSPYFLSTPLHAQDTSTPSTSNVHMPLTPPSELSEDNSSLLLRSPTNRGLKKNTHRRSQSTALHQLNSDSSPDLLTLLASQERKVMELKEELERAERELGTLKRSWAIHEASRKKVELKAGIKRSHSVQGSGRATTAALKYAQATSLITNSSGLGLSLLDEDDTEEARRELLKQKLLRRGTIGGLVEPPATAVKKPGQRVFSGSRHTRTLSLLSTNNANIVNQRKNSVGGNDKTRTSSESAPSFKSSFDLTTPPADQEDSFEFTSPLISSLSRSNTATSPARNKDSPSLNFGKTYKELASAASKRSIPQGLQIVNGSAEVLVKQGKTVVDGVRDGLWTFFEDIRQATVGDEAAREIEATPRRKTSDTSLARSKSARKPKEKETSFWKEFGIDTPQGDKSKKAIPAETTPVYSKQSHSHTRNFSKPLSLRQNPSSSPNGCKPTAPISTNPDDTPIEPDLMTEEAVTTEPTKLHEHESKSSTDSGISRTPPSVFSDFATQDGEGQGEGEDESWEWKSVESPASLRFKGTDSLKRNKAVIVDAEWCELAS